VCFPAGTFIVTDQGNVPIEKINPDFNTIENKKIVAITKTITQDKYLVCFQKHSLGVNYPIKKTIMSRHHKILYKGRMVKALKFIKNYFKGVTKIKYDGELLYNLLMEEYNLINVNNFSCETLHPNNLIAKLYTEHGDENFKNNIIIQINNSIKNEDRETYNEIIKSLKI